jgi:hypothetical protein
MQEKLSLSWLWYKGAILWSGPPVVKWPTGQLHTTNPLAKSCSWIGHPFRLICILLVNVSINLLATAN